MGTYAKQGSFTLNASTGNQSITGLGFTPKVVIFWSCQFATVSGGSEVHRFIGAATGSSNQFVVLSSVNQYNGYASRQTITSKCIRYNDALSDSAVMEASFVSLDTNGFTVNVTVGAANTINYLAVGGTGISAKVSYFDAPAQAASFSQTVSGVGFTPKALMMFSTGQQVVASGGSPEGVNGGEGINVGMCDQSLNQEATSHYQEKNVPTAKRSSYIGYVATYINSNGTGYDEGARVTSYNSDGFVLAYDAKWSGSVIRHGYIAFGGSSSFTLSSITEPVSTGTQTVTTASGVKPIASIFMSVNNSDSAGGIYNDSDFSFGVSANATQHTGSSYSLPNNNPATALDGYGGTDTAHSIVADGYSSPVSWRTQGSVTTNSLGSYTITWSKVSGSSYHFASLTITDVKTNPARMMIGLFN